VAGHGGLQFAQAVHGGLAARGFVVAQLAQFGLQRVGQLIHALGVLFQPLRFRRGAVAHQFFGAFQQPRHLLQGGARLLAGALGDVAHRLFQRRADALVALQRLFAQPLPFVVQVGSHGLQGTGPGLQAFAFGLGLGGLLLLGRSVEFGDECLQLGLDGVCLAALRFLSEGAQVLHCAGHHGAQAVASGLGGGGEAVQQALAHLGRQVGVGGFHLAVEGVLLAGELGAQLLAALLQAVQHGVQAVHHGGQGFGLCLQGVKGGLPLVRVRKGAQHAGHALVQQARGFLPLTPAQGGHQPEHGRGGHPRHRRAQTTGPTP